MLKVVVMDVAPATFTLPTVTPAPLTATLAPLAKLVPVSATATLVRRAPLAGLTEESVRGAGRSTVKVTAALVPPGVVTVTLRAPAAAVPAIVNVVIKPVLPFAMVTGPTDTPVPLTVTVLAPLTKLVPLSITLTVDKLSPLAGLIDVRTGGIISVIVNARVLLVPPPGAGFETEINRVPMSDATTVTFIVAPSIKVPPVVVPSTTTIVEDVNPDPLIVTSAGIPLLMDAEERLERTGTGKPTVNSAVFEFPPPGGGLLTTILWMAGSICLPETLINNELESTNDALALAPS